VVAKDIGSVVEAQGELRAAQQRYELALAGSSVALWDADLQTGKVYLSEAWAAMLGAKAGDTLTTLEELAALVHPDERDAVQRSLRDALKGTAPAYDAEHRVRAANGEWKWILSRGRVTQRDPASGRALRIIGTYVDIHDRKLAEEALERRAQDDARTGIAGQSLLLERLRRAMARSQRSGAPLALMHLDIDRFKPLADGLGPEAGEALLKDLGARLRGCVRATDTVARIGADQFVVLLEELKERGDAFRVAEKMLRAVREPVSVGEREVRLTTSIGVAFPDEAGLPPEELVKRAGAALSDAKAAGRDSYRIGPAGGASR
jgi:diguanylate cyclase (GGDEF)-like protein/PAS domain S-box-containing protein